MSELDKMTGAQRARLYLVWVRESSIGVMKGKDWEVVLEARAAGGILMPFWEEEEAFEFLKERMKQGGVLKEVGFESTWGIPFDEYVRMVGEDLYRCSARRKTRNRGGGEEEGGEEREGGRKGDNPVNIVAGGAYATVAAMDGSNSNNSSNSSSKSSSNNNYQQ